MENYVFSCGYPVEYNNHNERKEIISCLKMSEMKRLMYARKMRSLE